MKQIFFLFLTLPSLHTFSQTDKKEPAFYLDSVRIPMGTFSPTKIENINVVRDNDPTTPNGKVYIKSKNPKDFKFISAQDILKANNISIGTISIFILDNEIIKDTSTFKIDSSYILNVEVIKASEIEYLPHNIPNLAILKIFTATKENIDKQNVLRIRSKNSTDQ